MNLTTAKKVLLPIISTVGSLNPQRVCDRLPHATMNLLDRWLLRHFMEWAADQSSMAFDAGIEFDFDSMWHEWERILAGSLAPESYDVEAESASPPEAGVSRPATLEVKIEVALNVPLAEFPFELISTRGGVQNAAVLLLQRYGPIGASLISSVSVRREDLKSVGVPRG